MTVRKAVVFISSLLIIIILIGLVIFLIDSKTNNTNNTNAVVDKTSSGSVPEYNNYKDISSIGHIMDVNDGIGFYLTAQVKDVIKQGDSLLLEIETLNSKKEKVTKKLLVFKKNVTTQFFIEATDNLAIISHTKSTKITSFDEAYDKLNIYKENTFIAYLDLNPSAEFPVSKPYITNIGCNDNFHSYLKGTASENSCEGLTLVIYVKQ